MKIAMIGQNRTPSRETGIDVVVEKLAVGIAGEGHDVTAYNRKGTHVKGYNNINTPQKSQYEHEGVHVKTAFTVKNAALNCLVYSYFAVKNACKTRHDIIHFHGEASACVIKNAKNKGKRCIVTIHGIDWKRFKKNSIRARICQYGERMAVQYADEIIVLSGEDQKYFKDTYNRSTVFIPNGVDMPECYAPKVIKLKHALNGDDYILYVGRISPEKGVHTLLEAYSKSGIEVPLVLAGSGYHEEEYYHTIKAFADKFNDKTSRARRKARIVMTGAAQGRELEELYSNAVLFVLPSELEGMPISLMEAMSYGNICLVSDIPQNTAVVEQHGYCYEPDDPDSLLNSMRDIIGHLKEIREERGYTKEAIAAHILNKYSWENTVKQTLAVYQRSYKGNS